MLPAKRLSIAVLAGILVGCRGLAGAPSNAESPVAGSGGLPSPTLLRTEAPSAAPAGARDASGIPLEVGGEPVAIGLAAVVDALATTDATQFLIGGWFDDGISVCSGGIGRDPSPLLSGCATVVGASSPWGGLSYPGPQGQMYWDGRRLPGDVGPSIVRVHTHDPRARDCWSQDRDECAAVLVVDDVVWAGDEWTRAGPMSVVEAARRLGGLNILTEISTGPQSSLSVQRHLFPTPVAGVCLGPWPHEVFELHGDPRFGVLAVFSDEPARVNAQAQLDPALPGCGDDSRVARSDDALWAGVANVLVKVYGNDVRSHVEATLSGPEPDRYLPFPPASLDESYRFIDDAEAARAAGFLNGEPLTSDRSSNDWYAAYQHATYRRFAANALSYTIGVGVPVTKADVGSTIWTGLEQGAVPGTPRLYVVTHPNSTDPSLATERIIAFEKVRPDIDSWGLIVLPPPVGS